MGATCLRLVGLVFSITIGSSYVKGYCPDGPSSFYNGKCYHITIPVISSAGSTQCIALGYNPVKIETPGENVFIMTLLTEASWIGIMNVMYNAYWMLGGFISFQPFGSTVHASQDVTCYVINHDTGIWFTYDSANCNILRPFVCEMDELSDPLTTGSGPLTTTDALTTTMAASSTVTTTTDMPASTMTSTLPTTTTTTTIQTTTTSTIVTTSLTTTDTPTTTTMQPPAATTSMPNTSPTMARHSSGTAIQNTSTITAAQTDISTTHMPTTPMKTATATKMQTTETPSALTTTAADLTTTSLKQPSRLGDCRDDMQTCLTAIKRDPAIGMGQILVEKVVRRLGECLEVCYQVGCCSFYLYSGNMTCMTFSTNRPTLNLTVMDWAFYVVQ